MTSSQHGKSPQSFDPQGALPLDIGKAFSPGGDLDRIILGILSGNEEMILDRLNERVLRLAFLKNGQNQVRTAKALGVTRNVLRTYLKRYGMIT